MQTEEPVKRAADPDPVDGPLRGGPSAQVTSPPAHRVAGGAVLTAERVAGGRRLRPGHARVVAGGPRPRRRPVARRPALFFAACLAITFLNFAAWSIATPLFAAPDEPTQVAHAAAVVRGELVGETTRDVGNAATRITIPKAFAGGSTSATCFAFRDTAPASCVHGWSTSKKLVHTTTYVGRYPPLYYLIVGIPSLFAISRTGIYLMRLVSALLSALLISLALFSVAVWSRSRLLLVGVVAASTPLVWFLGGVVNPSGLEISAGICLWTAGLVLVLERAEHPPPGLLAIVAAAAAVFLLTRDLSPLWVAIIALLLALLGGWRAVVGISRARMARWLIGPVLACGLLSVGWIVSEHSLDLMPSGVTIRPHESSVHILSTIVGEIGFWINQMIGIFGWVDTRSPFLTYFVWFSAIGLVVALAFAVARIRQSSGLALLVLGSILIPVAIAYSQAHRLGIVWQGRDILPLAVGIPLVATALIEQCGALRRWRVRLAVVLCAGMGVAMAAAFLEALRRYAVGVDGPIDFLNGSWRPPLGLLTVAVVGCVVTAVYMALVVYGVGRSPELAGTGALPGAAAPAAAAAEGA